MCERKFWFRWISLIVLTFACWTVCLPSAKAYGNEEQMLLQAWRIVNQAYLDSTFNHQNWWFVRRDLLRAVPADREATYAAIEEMLASLDDPFTRLLKPEQYRSLQVSTAGELSGVGLQIDLNSRTRALEVVAPIAGSPADAAGLEPRDRILAIDGTPTQGLTLYEAVRLMRGPVGTTVMLTVRSPNTDGERDVSIVRDLIELNPVVAQLDTHSADVPVGYIRLTQFSANAATEVAQAVAELEARGAGGFVLDLRNNPGGLLQAGIEVARLWIDEGTIVYTVNRQGTLGSYEAEGRSITDAPLVVLVNGGSASASEILAGALQDNVRAVLVGERTFGKGLIQSLFELPDASGMAVTVAKYETPNHTDIHQKGISPDYEVLQPTIAPQQVGTETDEQYLQAVRLLTADSVVAEAA
ncbi:carboxyl-terminal processing protease CtpA [Rubidibacter lacunae]|nr:carboxyl-terminal processing protease CtpA [Rubidibacter lacunae]